MGIAIIVPTLAINRQTVRRYAYARALPERDRQAVRESQLDPFLPFLYAQWKTSRENASRLWREMQEGGYSGTMKQLLRWSSTRRRAPSKHVLQRANAAPQPLTPAEPSMSAGRPLPGAKRLAWLLCQTETDLGASERTTVARVR